MAFIFDPISGQMCVENTAKVTSMVRSWTKSTRGTTLLLPDHRHREGPPSLWDIAERALLLNLGELSVDALKAVPWSIGKRLWERIQRACVSDTLSIRMSMR